MAAAEGAGSAVAAQQQTQQDTATIARLRDEMRAREKEVEEIRGQVRHILGGGIKDWLV